MKSGIFLGGNYQQSDTEIPFVARIPRRRGKNGSK
jgi:hypothetical protein